MRRPFVLLNVAASIDGKVAPASRITVRLGSDRDQARMDRLRASSDAILIGAGTLRADDPPLQVRSAALRRRRRKAGRPAFLTEVILSRSLDLPRSSRFFRRSGASKIIAVPIGASGPRLARTGGRWEVIRAGRGVVDIAELLERLAERGVRRLLVEGGGETFAHFLAAGLVDEIHLTLCPLLVGGRGAPTLFEGQGFSAPPFPRLSLALCRREGDEVYLRYRRKGH